MGRPGTKNDFNILARSLFFCDVLEGIFQFRLAREYKLSPNGMIRHLMYLLTHGIYSAWPLFAKPVPDVPGQTKTKKVIQASKNLFGRTLNDSLG